MAEELRLSQIICTGYEEYWRSKAFFRVIKGSKGSGKSKTAALWHIFHMMRYKLSNTLVVRKTYASLKDSTYTDLLWAIDRLGATKAWAHSLNPLQLTFKRDPDDERTWQTILFRGLDDPQKIASVAVRNGWLNWVWFEEASQITNFLDYEKVVMSIRGYIPPEMGLWKSVTITFNPWSDKHWLKSEYFDTPKDNVLTLTTTYKNNRWLGREDIRRYEELYKTNPRLARIICDGDWGVSEGLVYENWEVQDFDILEVAREYPKLRFTFGLDFGYSISYNAFAAVAIDMDSRTLWIFDEIYERGMSNYELAKRITEKGYQNEVIVADCAEPKSIYELRQGFRELVADKEGNMIPDENGQPQYNRYVLPNIRSAMKGNDSLQNGIQRLQSFRIIIHERKCPGAIDNFSNYTFAMDKDGNFLDRPIKEHDHCLVAGTMVLTDRGEVPIEGIKVGDMVMTHLGFREVLASGVTRPEPAEIWRMTLEDGTILEGTSDHPIPTTDGLKYMVEILPGQEVVGWERLRKNCNLESTSASIAESISYTNPSEGINSAPMLVNLQLEESRGSTMLSAFVQYVAKHSSATNIQKPYVVAGDVPTLTTPVGDMDCFKPIRVASIEKTTRFEPVYDLTVDEAHSFFANSILVLNCPDATRYALECIFCSSPGTVTEGGVDKPIEVMEPAKHKCRRVFSTYD